MSSDRPRKIDRKLRSEELERVQRRLHALLHPDTRTGRPYAVVTHAAASGTSRSIRFLAFDPARGEIADVSWLIACVLDWPYSARGVQVSGCGMNMTFHTLYSVYLALKSAGLDMPEDYADFTRYAG